jgi:hypothetical protein
MRHEEADRNQGLPSFTTLVKLEIAICFELNGIVRTGLNDVVIITYEL